MRTRIKICCIVSIDEAQLAIAAGADALGLLPGAQAAAIAAWTPPPVSTFLMTAETTAARIAAQLAEIHPTTVQINQPLAPAEAAALAHRAPQVRRVQVIRVEDGSALSPLDQLAFYAPHVQAFLLDMGTMQDWPLAARFVRASSRPVFLAGGLDDSTLIGALRQVRPYGIELCSCVRTGGQLDVLKLATLTSAVREADAVLYAEG